MVDVTPLPDGSFRLPDGRIMRPATQNQMRAEQLIEELFNDPELGPKAHDRAQKKFGDIRPHAATVIKQAVVEPEVAGIRKALEESNEKLNKALERLNARDKRDEEEKTLNELRAAVKTAVDKYSLTPEGEQKMLDWMRENKVYNAEAAAAVVVHNAPPAPSSGPSWAPSKANFYGTASADEAFTRLHKDPIGFQDEEIAKFLQNPAQYAAEAA
jgi:hypothetical protein